MPSSIIPRSRPLNSLPHSNSTRLLPSLLRHPPKRLIFQNGTQRSPRRLASPGNSSSPPRWRITYITIPTKSWVLGWGLTSSLSYTLFCLTYDIWVSFLAHQWWVFCWCSFLTYMKHWLAKGRSRPACRTGWLPETICRICRCSRANLASANTPENSTSQHSFEDLPSILSIPWKNRSLRTCIHRPCRWVCSRAWCRDALFCSDIARCSPRRFAWISLAPPLRTRPHFYSPTCPPPRKLICPH